MKRIRVGVLISGRGSNMRALVEAAHHDTTYEVVLVASDRPAVGLAWAAEQGIATMEFPSPTPKDKSQYHRALDLNLRRHNVELIALAGYMRLLSPEFVARWRGRIVNIHPSLLPRYKGLDTHARALAAGDSVAGCSVHLVTEELDAGEVLGQAEVPIVPGDTPDTLAARVLVEEHRLYPRALADYAQAMNAPLARVRAIALALPDAAERLSHGAPGFHIAEGRFFAYFWSDHHGDGKTAVLVKTADREEQAMLVEQDPNFYYRPAYLGASGWVAMRVGTPDTDWDRVGDRIAQSWELVAPAALLEAGGR